MKYPIFLCGLAVSNLLSKAVTLGATLCQGARLTATGIRGKGAGKGERKAFPTPGPHCTLLGAAETLG